MKKKYFDLGLYVDSLKRCMLIGGLFTVLLCIQSFITAFGYRIIFTNYSDVTIRAVGLLEINPMVLTVPLLMTPLLMFNLFGFLTKRSTSDFWHSTPFTRECLFFTFCLAVFSWSFIAVLLSSLCSVVSFSLMPQFFAINFSSVISVAISTIVLILMVMGAFTISSSITGTTFNNIIIACIILFLPRALIIYFGALTSHSILFSNITTEGFGSYSLNLIFGALISSVNGSDFMNESMSSASSIIYSLVLAILYLLLGAMLFKHRKSESASYSAVNKHLQTVFRIIVSFIVCLIPIYIAGNSFITRGGLNYEEIFIVIVLYIITIAVYLIYELITTKKAINMLKALPKLWILAVINIVVIITAVCVYNAEYNFTPSAETVKSIKISNNGNISRHYFDKMMSETDISDDEIEEFLSNAYSKTRKSYEDKTLRLYNGTIVKVGFKTGVNYKYRSIYLDKNEYQEFAELLNKNDNIRNIYNIENILENAISYDANIYLAANNGKIWDNEQKTIIDLYIDDVRSMPFAEWYTIASDGRVIVETESNEYYNTIGSVSISVNIKGVAYYVNLPITNQMPRTYSYILGKIHEEQSATDLRQLTLTALQNATSQNNSVYIELYNGTTKTSPEGYTVYGDNAQKLYDILSNSPYVAPTAESRIATIRFEYFESDSDELDGKPSSHWAIFKIPDDADLTFLIEKFILNN